MADELIKLCRYTEYLFLNVFDIIENTILYEDKMKSLILLMEDKLPCIMISVIAASLLFKPYSLQYYLYSIENQINMKIFNYFKSLETDENNYILIENEIKGFINNSIFINNSDNLDIDMLKKILI